MLELDADEKLQFRFFNAYDCPLKKELFMCDDVTAAKCDRRLVVYLQQLALPTLTNLTITETRRRIFDLKALDGDVYRKQSGQFPGELLK